MSQWPFKRVLLSVAVSEVRVCMRIKKSGQDGFDEMPIRAALTFAVQQEAAIVEISVVSRGQIVLLKHFRNHLFERTILDADVFDLITAQQGRERLWD